MSISAVYYDMMKGMDSCFELPFVRSLWKLCDVPPNMYILPRYRGYNIQNCSHRALKSRLDRAIETEGPSWPNSCSVGVVRETTKPLLMVTTLPLPPPQAPLLPNTVELPCGNPPSEWGAGRVPHCRPSPPPSIRCLLRTIATW